MARHGLRLILCAALLGAPGRPAPAQKPDPDARLRDQLAVQAALEEGLDALKRGDHAGAVKALEARLALIDGNRRYLEALRDAYRGYVRQLQGAGRAGEASTYLRRLAILEPRGALTPTSPAPVTPVVATTPDKREESPEKPAPERAGRPAVSRGKVDDPFADSNSASAQRAKALLERAERAFAGRDYESARDLYEQAHRESPSATDDCRERWAYCKLRRVAEALRAESGGPSEDLGREVREALALAPKLDGFGKDLLRKMEGRTGGAGEDAEVEVKHTGAGGSGWSVAETPNFRVFHKQPRASAERAARIAEATRTAMTRKWFGEIPAAWSPRCDVYLHATATDYARATGAPAGSPGHSTMSLDGGRVLSRRIDLRCDEPHLFDSVLPHETTHVVLAGRFGGHTVPRWADEGVAVLTEPQERINLHLHNLPKHRADGHLFGLGQLMQMTSYPEPRYVGPFYAQSVSLVDFLSKKKGPVTFTRFLREGLDGGYEPALRKHYGFGSFAELDRAWRAHVFGEAATTSERKR
jgi:tetratricopeptide (TPR) repeat protein